MISPASFTLAAGVVNLVMALVLWTLLRRRHDTVRVLLWALGALAAGGWMILVALRPQLPQWASFQLANALGYASVFTRLICLRLESGARPQWLAHGAAWLLALLLYQLTLSLGSIDGRLALGLLVHGLAGLLLCRYAWQAALAMRSPTGRVLARVEAVWVAVLAARLSMVLVDPLPLVPLQGSSEGWGLVALAMALAVFGNLAYLGMVLDFTQAREVEARQAQSTEESLRRQAEKASQELKATLAQRDALFRQRERLLSVLAHEIRQPLHSAAGALESADSALRALPTLPQTETIGERLTNAQSVLGELRSVLDNTLAAGDVLARDTPPVMQEVDVDWLLALALGDLPQSQRSQVDVIRRTRLRSLDVEPGLIRLAIRNLLRNAFVHGLGIQGRVSVIIEESSAPDALCIRVVDHGPGLSESRLAEWMSAAQDLDQRLGHAEHGLGLAIVSRIMTLHGGWLSLTPATPRGLVASLVFPWADEPNTVTPSAAAP